MVGKGSSTLRLVFVLLFLPGISLCGNILAVFPYQGKSHQIVFHALLGVLTNRGHNVTVITSVPLGNQTNLNEIVIQPKTGGWSDLFDFEMAVSMSPRFERTLLEELSENILESLVSSKEVEGLINSDSEFDVVITETFAQEPLVLFGHRFRAPVISLSTCAIPTAADYLAGNHHNPALVPEFKLPYTDRMTFIERLHNFLEWALHIAEFEFYYLDKRDRFVRENLKFPGSEEMPSTRQLLSNISLHLINMDNIAGIPRPHAPNIIQIPGIHIGSTGVLSTELQEVMDKSKHGVLYFSLGSLAPVSKLPKDVKEAFIGAFSKIKQTVLWRADEDVQGVSPNVKVKKWLPQQEILGHAKCVGFLTHGGLLSKQEAMYFGVPVIGIPLFGDQPSNVAHSEYIGFGIRLDYDNITEGSVLWAIDTVVNDYRYQTKAKEVSAIFKEKVDSSKETALYWIEYVMKYRGASHLLTPASQLPLYQLYLLEVFSLFILASSLLICILYFTLRTVLRFISYYTRTATTNKRKLYKDN